MKLKTKLNKLRKGWVNWLLYGDEVNGKIEDKFEGIIGHSLEEHSLETIEQIIKLIESSEPLKIQYESFDSEELLFYFKKDIINKLREISLKV